MLLGRFAADYLNYTPSSSIDGTDSITSALFVALTCALILVLVGVVLKAQWNIYRKAGQRPWAALIPFYNQWVWAKIAGRPGWWGLVAMLLYVVPIIGWIMPLIMAVDIAKRFGRSSLFGVVWLWFVGIVGVLILGYGSSTYHTDASVAPSVSTPPTPLAGPETTVGLETTETPASTPSAPASTTPQPPVAPDSSMPVETTSPEPQTPAVPEQPMPTPPPAPKPENPEPQGPPPPPTDLVR